MLLRRALCGLAICALAVVALGPAAADRNYGGERFTLSIDGVGVVAVKSLAGGAVSADVITERQGAEPYARKHIAGPSYEPIEIQMGFGNDKGIYTFISDSWKGNNKRINGAIQAADNSRRDQSEMQFRNALLTETTFPALDGNSKEAAYLTVKLTPESIGNQKGSGGASPAGGINKGEHKAALVNNFTLEIDGLDCSHVQKIDSFTVKKVISTSSVGEARDSEKTPGRLQFPNLVVTIGERSAESWQKWADDFMIKGNNHDDKEKNGTITLLGADMRTVMARITLRNVGICRFGKLKATSSSEAPVMTVGELYVEQMEFEGPGGAASDSTTKPPATGDPAASDAGKTPAASDPGTPAVRRRRVVK